MASRHLACVIAAAYCHCTAGEWQDDRRHGQGSCQFANGDKYQGGWVGGWPFSRQLGSGSYRHQSSTPRTSTDRGSACGLTGLARWAALRQCGGAAMLLRPQLSCERSIWQLYSCAAAHCCALLLSLAAGEWRVDKRHGQGVCKFADGRKFRGEAVVEVRISAWLAGSGRLLVGAAVRALLHTAKQSSSCAVCPELQLHPAEPAHISLQHLRLSLTAPAGEWEDDGWLQSSADPAHCRVAGPGVTRAVAGQTAELLIEVGACLRETAVLAVGF